MLGDDLCHPAEILVEQHKGLFGAEPSAMDVKERTSEKRMALISRWSPSSISAIFRLPRSRVNSSRYKARVGFGQGSLLAQERCLNSTSLAPLFVEALGQGNREKEHSMVAPT